IHAEPWLDRSLLSLARPNRASSPPPSKGTTSGGGRSDRGRVATRPAITPYDGWVLGRVLSVDASLNGDLDSMSPPSRRLVEHLASRPLAERKPLFDAWLIGQPDPDPIIEVIAGQDPQGPPPNPATEEEAEEWEPLSLDDLPEAV